MIQLRGSFLKIQMHSQQYFRQPAIVLKKEEIAAYTGTYYNEETEAAYTVIGERW